MEIEYVNKDDGQGEENFILPQTEKTINQIIGEITHFFSACRIVLHLVYVVYLVLRFFYLERFRFYTICLLAVCLIQFVFFIVHFKSRKKISQKIIRPVNYAKRLVTLAIALIVVMDIFGSRNVVYRWQAITGVLLCLGWILSLSGDVFAATVPRYSRMILASFKKDIEPQSLATRSLSKVKEAAGNMAKRKAVRSWRNIKSWFKDLVD